ncbi:MAG: DNA mismatch repair protein MutS, partial [Clostridia bacterium]|nr:DNA mismatch repair protein MutS [Clostridia bacterium]
DRLNDVITEVMPAEIICNFHTKEMIENLPANKIFDVPQPFNYLEKSFIYENAVDSLKTQFGQTALSVFEMGDSPAATIAAGALVDYLLDTQKVALKQMQKIKKLDLSKYMIIDSIARRNLELMETIRSKRRSGTLLSVIDYTKTAMGARMLRAWINEPLVDEQEINLRLDGVEELYQNLVLRENLVLILKNMRDIQRLTSKIGMKTAMPRDFNSLKESLVLLPEIKGALKNVKSEKLREIVSSISDLSEAVKMIEMVIAETVPAHLKDGGYISIGFNAELDRQRNIKETAAQEVILLEEQERARTGIDRLRIGFSKVYGYYIEVPTELAAKVPFDYRRKQTVAKMDRYFNDPLKMLEDEVLAGAEKAKKLEYEIFTAFREQMLGYIEPLQTTSRAISELDSLISLALVANKYNYVRPIINSSVQHIKIEDGRHPIVEANLKSAEFIANNTLLSPTDDKILIITGPNMAGKSTYMRQVAIITLLAHIGSFVPAKSAEIAITDRIFTRVGASDDLASGQSTFMVEMMEMANILNNATDKSLVILDEIGRGTSTFDGLSIAWAVVEYFTTRKTKVLFATHYHELSELEGMLAGIKNYQIAVKEFNNSIIFLHKIVRGGANRSFGIEVADLAGLPKEIIQRAKEISHNIAQEDFNVRLATTNVQQPAQAQTENQMQNLKVVNLLKDININKISPLEAFEILQDIIKKLK